MLLIYKVPRTHEWTTRGYVTNSWGYGAIVQYPVTRFFVALPYFRGDGANAAKMCALIWRVVVIKRLNVEKPENKLSHEG